MKHDECGVMFQNGVCCCGCGRTEPKSAADVRTPLARRGLLHGSTHAPDHDDILRVMEGMAKTQLWLIAVATTALVVALVALRLAAR